MTVPHPATPAAPSTRPAAVLVLGLGNLLLSDEGVGVHAVAALRERYDLPDSVEVLDGGTAGMDLLDIIAGRDTVIVIDALRREGTAAGTLLTFRGDDIRAAFGARLSPHQLGLLDVLAATSLLGEAPGAVTVIGIVPANLDLGLELSATVAASLDALLVRIADELACLGVVLRQRAP